MKVEKIDERLEQLWEGRDIILVNPKAVNDKIVIKREHGRMYWHYYSKGKQTFLDVPQGSPIIEIQNMVSLHGYKLQD